MQEQKMLANIMTFEQTAAPKTDLDKHSSSKLKEKVLSEKEKIENFF